MKNLRYNDNKKDFFEGWYFKHSSPDIVISFIAGVSVSKNEKKAFVQVITGDFSHSIYFEPADFELKQNELYIKVGNNVFSDAGIYINIDTKDLEIHGNISYGKFDKLNGNVMGPFKNMECNHEIISMHHGISGKLAINGKSYIFDGGCGYIEKDWGRSFPDTYFWAQSFDKTDGTAVFAAAAKVPFLGFKFLGHTAVVKYKGKSYKFATFRLGKVKSYKKDCLQLKNGAYTLTIRPKSEDAGQRLSAPENGEMSRTVYESCDSKLDITLAKNGEILFEKTNIPGSYEYCL